MRCSAVIEPFGRTRTTARVSGSSVRIFQRICSPMKPVTPVMTIFWPDRRSFRRPVSSGGTCAVWSSPKLAFGAVDISWPPRLAPQRRAGRREG